MLQKCTLQVYSHRLTLVRMYILSYQVAERYLRKTNHRLTRSALKICSPRCRCSSWRVMQYDVHQRTMANDCVGNRFHIMQVTKSEVFLHAFLLWSMYFDWPIIFFIMYMYVLFARVFTCVFICVPYTHRLTLARRRLKVNALDVYCTGTLVLC